ncbi:MAG: efflux RND transporter periplasmic adaptor subunit, partial [Methylococcales bacterium]|nr:efflux RND transporter periplasmic adaptor subunit [Methylococcales bacterium]
HFRFIFLLTFLLTTHHLGAQKELPEQHEDHGEHEHEEQDAEKKEPDEDDHEDHEDHDEQEEEGLKFTQAQLNEFSIKLAQVHSGMIHKTLALSGEVSIDPQRVYHITSQVAGTVHEVHKQLGDQVKKGDLLFSLVSRDLVEVKAKLIAAKSQLDYANQTLERERLLFEEGITAKRDYLAAQQAQAEMSGHYETEKQHLFTLGVTPRQISAILNRTDQKSSLYPIVASASGVVIEQHVTQGEVFDPSKNSLTLANLEKVWVNLTVYQKDLALIQQGQTVWIKDRFSQGKKATVQGKIQWISPILDEKTRSATARITINNPYGNWRPGLFVKAKVTLAKNHVNMMIPQSALQTLAGKKIVFVQHKKGEFEPQEVIIGRKNKNSVEIIKGLTLGQTYVSEKAFVLKAQMQKGHFGHGHSH